MSESNDVKKQQEKLIAKPAERKSESGNILQQADTHKSVGTKIVFTKEPKKKESAKDSD